MKYDLKIFLLLAFGNVFFSENKGVLSSPERSDEHSRILSRCRRYLVFPDGSTFQFVFYTQNQGYLQLGDIIWFGNTAALAWNLPTDPKLFSFSKDNKIFEEAESRNGISKLIYFLDENGKVLTKMPYRKKFLISPVFGKRSIEDFKENKKNYIKELNVKKMHIKQKNTKLLEKIDKDSIEFHRQGRVSLFSKLETFIEGLGWHGKECVLRMLCESGKDKSEQGTFLEEILRATFTLPHGEEFLDPDHKEYDKAHRFSGNCDQRYPECSENRELLL